MNDPQVTGWLLTVFGLYAIAAALGEHLRPGEWKKMIRELNESSALSFLAGLLVLSLGTAISLAHPFDTGGSWRETLVNIIGYGMVIEGLSFLAFPKSVSQLGAQLMTAANPLWVLIAAYVAIAASAQPVSRHFGADGEGSAQGWS